jgi:uncharacterized protein (DUF3820 family)
MAEPVWTLVFGKHIGKSIEDVPNSYLKWLLEQEWFCTTFCYAVAWLEKELDYRERFDITIKEQRDG